MNPKRKRVVVIGAGAWGTALACVCARNGHETTLWGRDSKAVASINARNENPGYLPGIRLPASLTAMDNLEQALEKAEMLLLVTPAQTIAAMSKTIANLVPNEIPVVVCAKGIDRKTGKLPAQTAAELMPGNPLAALSGPSFATDVANNLPTAVTLAANDLQIAEALSRQISGPAFRVYASDDLKGVELGGALKNVIALAVGVCRGMKLGASAEAALVARGFAELSRLATALGARSSTLMGLSGLGDLVLTCSGEQSRNFAFGVALGKADSISDMPEGLKLAEGALTASVAARIAKDNAIEAPVITTAAGLIDGRTTARQAVAELLARPLKNE